MDRFQLMAKDKLLQIDAIYKLYAGHLEVLHDIKDVSLRRSGQKNGNAYYYKCDPQSGKRVYLGTDSNDEVRLMIANMLFTNNVPYIYECPYFFDGEILRFDFTALSTIDYETEVIVEHQGMMDLDAYRGKYMHSLMTCLGSELIPNVDIFFTFEDTGGNFDSRQIWDIIRTRLIQTE